MTNLATTLLDFILELLRNPSAAAEFNADPQGALASAGLQDVTPDDVHAVLPMLADCSPVRNWAVHDGAAPHEARWQPQHAEHGAPVHTAAWDRDRVDHHDGEGHEYAVIKHLQTIQNTYTITETHDSHDVWAHGDATVLFGNDSTLLSNVKADDSFNGSLNDDHSVTHTNEVNGNGNVTGEGNDVHAENSGNTIGEMDKGSVLGNGNDVDNSSDSHDLSARDIQFGGNSIHATDSENVGSTNVDGENNALGAHSQVTADSTVAGHDVIQDSTVAGHDANSGEQISVGHVAIGDTYDVDAHTAVVDSTVDHSDVAGGGIDESEHLFSDNEVSDNHLLSDNFSDNHLPHAEIDAALPAAG